MCPPALIPALTIASTAVTMAGQLQSGLYASRLARYQAQVADQNKAMVHENAADAIVQGQAEQRRLGREIAGRVGAQEARMGANNVDLSFGSAARLTEDTRMIGAEDQAALAENVRRQVRGMQTDIWNFESEKRAKKAEASQAMTGAMFGMASTALGGATQYAKFKAGRAD
jgi:hypothetical protein